MKIAMIKALTPSRVAGEVGLTTKAVLMLLEELESFTPV